MNLLVLTPGTEIFSGKVKAVKVPGVSGQFEVLTGHAPIVSSLKEGNIKITKDNGEVQNIEILNGFIEVLNNEISLLVQGL